MNDVHSRKQRSYNMSRIRGKDTGPELTLRKALWASGIRYRIKNTLAGKPDIILVGPKVAVFVDGCFWHRCPTHYKRPKNNADFWEEKINANVLRDKRVNSELTEAGWHVVRFWEHDVKYNLTTIVSEIRNLAVPPN